MPTTVDAPVRVSYLRYVAEAPVCGSWPTNLAEQRDNGNYPNFGCANQRNLAVMVSNPADLVGPRTESDRPAERRDADWDRYVNGESTGTEKSADERVQARKVTVGLHVEIVAGCRVGYFRRVLPEEAQAAEMPAPNGRARPLRGFPSRRSAKPQPADAVRPHRRIDA